MRLAFYALLFMIAFVLCACGSSSENPSTQVSEEVSSTETASALLIWESSDPSCETVAITAQSLSYGICGDALIAVPEEMTNHSARFSELSDLYTSFTAETPAGNLIFRGSGSLVPSEAEERAMAEWARLMFQVAQAGQTDTLPGVAFAWQREGGPGDFCDNVVVYLTGWMAASDCTGYSVEGYLMASQLNQVFAWVDDLSSVDHTETFPASTGGLKMTLELTGNGQGQADDETIWEIFEFAATQYTELRSAAQAGEDVEEARQVLQDFLMALNSGDYARAAELYSGDISTLQSWNPDVEADLPTLLARGCMQNGLQCLQPRFITYRVPDSDGGYHFYVEFNNVDNTLFQQGACCGETSAASLSLFPFLVEKSANGLAVTDLPPYVP